MYDAVIVGYGPAGISCAIYLKRYGYNVLVIGKDNGALANAHLIENYYGIDSISGADLIASGINQAKKLGIEIVNDEVINIEKYDNFTIETVNNSYQAKTVLLATGLSRNKWNLGKKFEGKGVSYCATCDGFFYRKKKVAIIGSGKYMEHELSVLERICSDITIFTNGEEISYTANENIKVNTNKIVELLGDENLEAIKTSKEIVPIDGCFVALGSASGFTMAMHMGILMEGNSIKVDEGMQTNVEGLYAAGDVTGGLLQVSKAVGDGAIAATSMSKYLKGK